MSFPTTLESMPQALPASGEPLLAGDESFLTIEKRFKDSKLPSTDEWATANDLETRDAGFGCWFGDLPSDQFSAASSLSQFAGRVSESGEGRWTVKTAIDEGMPVPVLTSALLCAIRFPRRGGFPGQGTLGHALRVRRPSGEIREIRSNA